MQEQIFYIHGGNAYSHYDDFLKALREKTIWYPHGDKPKLWGSRLRESLPDYEVFTPEMPNAENAKYQEWKIWFERHFEFINDGVTLLGWSLGGYFLLKYLSENKPPFKIDTLLLVASPVKPDDFGGEDGGDFSFDVATLHVLMNKIENIHIFHSKDDFAVPYEHALELKEILPSANLHTFEDRNHFLQEEFPELISLIK